VQRYYTADPGKVRDGKALTLPWRMEGLGDAPLHWHRFYEKEEFGLIASARKKRGVNCLPEVLAARWANKG